VLIPYGGDQSVINLDEINVLHTYGLKSGGYAFIVCRIEPENNIELILNSFTKFRKLKLVIVGNWDNSNYGRKLRIKFGRNDNFLLLDPIYDQGELNQLRVNCYIYVHGHSAGGTNPSLVEAMNMNLAILAFDCSFNRETTNSLALFFDSAEGLAALLESLTDIVVNDLGVAMGVLARERYTWSRISLMYAEVFDSPT
jgi:glycosyltransferase involved in cell wall biosynthesis